MFAFKNIGSSVTGLNPKKELGECCRVRSIMGEKGLISFERVPYDLAFKSTLFGY